MFHRRMLLAAVGAALALTCALPHAQDKFPSRPIELIVPTPPGGGVDIVARMLGELAEPVLGVKVVVVNKPGGTGAIGVAQLTQAKPDGYTLAVVWNAPLTVTPHTLAVSYTLDDYTPISQLTGGTPFVFCVKPEFPAANGKEFVELLRKNPNKFTYGNDGVAGTVQLAAERAFGKLGVSARPVPFGGAGETLKNFLGGHVDIYGGTIPTIIEYVRSGQAKCLLVTAPDRTPVLPDTTSLSDLGIADTASELWRGIIGPKGMPADRVAALQQAFHKATQQRKFQEFEASRGESAVGGPPGEFSKLIKNEYEANAEILKRLGLAKKN
jgi:tripartite-type tricarboxylate transporter receptor subunit TctC